MCSRDVAWECAETTRLVVKPENPRVNGHRLIVTEHDTHSGSLSNTHSKQHRKSQITTHYTFQRTRIQLIGFTLRWHYALKIFMFTVIGWKRDWKIIYRSVYFEFVFIYWLWLGSYYYVLSKYNFIYSI